MVKDIFYKIMTDSDQRDEFNGLNDSHDAYEFFCQKGYRGSFEELYKSKKWGQISDNVAYPGITKGGHYHTYKKEIFYTVIGKSEIKQRDIKTNEKNFLRG